jgi:diguanylate cyclase (GGDEF)-like protein
VNQNPDPNARAAADAAGELAELQGQVEAARALLIRLLQDVVEAESRLGSSQAAQLLEANEQLVVAALRNQTDAELAGRALNEASRSAELDALTRLPNRVLLLDRLTLAIANAKRRGTRLALLFLDLDNFKQINDTLGHAAGDEVLQRAAHCLAASVRDGDTVSRHGGDEFVILLTEVAQAADAALVADKVIAALDAPARVGEHALRLSASIGISVYPDHGDDADTLIDRADAAMYRAKREAPGSYAFHGAAPRANGRHAPPLAEHERRNAQLREANEQLVLAALGAQELQAAAEQAQRRQREFLAVVAHELRNPLAPIRIATALLGRVRTDEPLLPRARALIEQQVANLARLVGELLDLPNADTATPPPDRRVVDLAASVDAVARAWRPAMQARRQAFDVQMPTGALDVLGDPIGLAQILDNLLDNASKFTHPHGTIGLTVEVAHSVARGVAGAGHSVVMTVADSGIGIGAEALPTVFEPFVQDTHAIGFSGVGLGIGLTVVRALVEAHGGDVVASSAGRGLGSRFVVTLPLVQIAPVSAGAEARG